MQRKWKRPVWALIPYFPEIRYRTSNTYTQVENLKNFISRIAYIQRETGGEFNFHSFSRLCNIAMLLISNEKFPHAAKTTQQFAITLLVFSNWQSCLSVSPDIL